MKTKLKKTFNIFIKPYGIIVYLCKRGRLKFINDELYIKLSYRFYFNRKINLKKPKSFTEKLNWLKLNDRSPLKSKLTDKIKAKEVMSDYLGEEIIIPTLGVYDRYEDINFDILPDSFVLKCNHDSASAKIIYDKIRINHRKLKKFYNKKLTRNYYYTSREFNYNNISPKIIVEPLILDENNKVPQDFRFFVFNGEVAFISVDTQHDNNHTRLNYNKNWEKQVFEYGRNSTLTKVDKPKNLNKMIQIAEKIGKNFIHVRVDLYVVDNKIYFGETTFCHSGGLQRFVPDKYDYIIGDKLSLDSQDLI